MRVAWGGRYPKHINWSLGFPRARFLDPPLLHIHYITGSHHTGTWLLLPFLCCDAHTLSLISTRWSNGSCTDLRLPGGHLGMDEKTPSTAEPGKDWASCLPCHSNSTAWLHDSVRFITITPSASVRNLGVIFDDQLTFKEHIAKTARSCRFALHNIRKIRPFLTEHAAQLLVQALSFLGWTTAMLFWLDFHQTQSNLTNDSECSGTTGLQRAQKSTSHLSLSSCTVYQLQLASSSRHWCLHIKHHRLSTPPTSTHYYESTSLPEV